MNNSYARTNQTAGKRHARGADGGRGRGGEGMGGGKEMEVEAACCFVSLGAPVKQTTQASPHRGPRRLRKGLN